MKIDCPFCGVANRFPTDKLAIEGMPLIKCFSCEELFAVKMLSETICDGVVFDPHDDNDLKIGDHVIFTNKDHQLFKQNGIIIDIDYKHYKVNFNNITIWVPNNWVELDKENK